MKYYKRYTYANFTADMRLVEACVFKPSRRGELCHVADVSLQRFSREFPEERCMVCTIVLFMIMREQTSALLERLSARTFWS